MSFTLVVFAVFTLSEHINAKKRKLTAEHKTLEEFNLDHQPQVNAATLHARPGLRSGGGARLSQHGAPEEGAAKRSTCAATTLW